MFSDLDAEGVILEPTVVEETSTVASSNKGGPAIWIREGSLNSVGHGLVLGGAAVRMTRAYDSIHARYRREVAETYWQLGHPKPLWNI